MTAAMTVVFCAALLWLAFVAMVTMRQRAVAQRLGSFPMRVRKRSGGSVFWPGTAHYSGGELEFYRTFSLSRRPTLVWAREGLTVLGREPVPGPAGDAQWLVRCGYRDPTHPGAKRAEASVDLLLSEAAYTGIASWLEAAPPGIAEGVL